jgi:hypothetical protein
VAPVVTAGFVFPLAPIGSRWFKVSIKLNDNLREDIGWKELVERVAAIYNSLPPDERAESGILAGNYGEAGAIDLYGGADGLPKALSPVNSFWVRGYGSKPPRCPTENVSI